MAKIVGRAKKTETFTTRLEPRVKYVLELLSRLTGRSIAKTLEEGIQLQAAAASLGIAGRPELNQSLDSMMSILWSPQEWKRLVALSAVAPDLLTHLEQCKLALLYQSTALCSPPVYNKFRAVKRVELVPRLIEIAWPLIEDRAEKMAEGQPAPHPTLLEIEKAHGEPLNFQPGEEGLMMDFSVLGRD